MKILVVQLLRLGDVILSSPVIQGLRDQYPNAQIDILINKQFEGVAKLLPKIDHCYTFDRQEIQSSLGEKEKFVFEGFNRVEALLRELRVHDYDQIINLTHNRLSAYLVGALECRERVGLWIDNQNKALIESAWFHHLNKDDLVEASERFHFVDIYKAAAQIDRPRLGISIKENRDSQKRAESFLRSLGIGPNIVVQPLTSDIKKNWSIQSFRNCIESIQKSIPDAHFTILGAPSEERTLLTGFVDLKHCQVLICDLDVAYSVIARSDLLITGDTSIKHLAAGTKTPIVELSLGSSDFRKTGCYSENAIIVQSQESCAPCSHLTDCHRTEHFCSQLISPELISLIAADRLRTASSQLKKIATEFANEAKIYKVDIQTTGTWIATDVLTPFASEEVESLFQKFVAKLYNQHLSQDQDIFEIFGSESGRFTSLLKHIFGNRSGAEWKILLAVLERKFCSKEEQVFSLENRFYEFQQTDKNPLIANELMKSFLAFKEGPRVRTQKFQMNHAMSEQTPIFVRLRKLQLVLQEVKLKSDIEIKLIRSLQNIMEA